MLFGLAAALTVLPSWLASSGSGALRIGGESAPAAQIDIHTAPWYEWTLLEGIGEARARRIVEHRERLGGFRSIHDLEGVPGLPRDWIEKARPYLLEGSGEDG